MTLKEFLQNFDTNNPDWSQLPEDWPDCDLAGLTSEEVGRYNSIRVLWELSRPEKPQARSRVWTSSRGYTYLVSWTNAVLLRILVRKVTDDFSRSEYRGKAQTDDAARSVVANIEEGFKRATTVEYLDFLGYSQGSLEEVKGDIGRWLQDGLVSSRPGSSVEDLGIDWKAWHNFTKNPLNSSKILLFPLKDSKGQRRTLKSIKGEEITYEMLMELSNKTDWHFRKLVVSLERKLADEQRGYQVEQARIRDKFKKR